MCLSSYKNITSRINPYFEMNRLI